MVIGGLFCRLRNENERLTFRSEAHSFDRSDQMDGDDRNQDDGPQYGKWLSRDEQRQMQLKPEPEDTGERGSRRDRAEGGDEEFSYEAGEERPGREMQERMHLADETLFDHRQRNDPEPREDLSKTPDDDHRSIRQQQDRIRHQGEPATPEERLGAGWADPDDPTQSIYEETVNEDEENLAEKRI